MKKVAVFMSGSGTNTIKIIEASLDFYNKTYIFDYKVEVIFTDNSESNAVHIGNTFDIPVVVRDIKSYYRKRNKFFNDMEVREKFDKETVKALRPYECPIAAYAGYMSIASSVLVENFFGINVHPADLRIMEGDERKCTGANAVRDAILAGETYIASTTHKVIEKVDYGEILMVSDPLKVELVNNFDPENKDMLD